MRLAFNLFGFLLFLFIFSCSSIQKKNSIPNKNSDYTNSAKQYMPLAIGNSWTYAVNYLGQKGKYTVFIVKKEKNAFIDNKNNKLIIDKRGIRDAKRYLIKFPLNDKQPWISIISPIQKEIRRVVKFDAKVVVPAGIFKGCLVVQTDVKMKKGIILHSLNYFAQNVGLVKIQTFLEDTINKKLLPQTETELLNFHLNDKKN
jgi:hypothetical protein